MTDKRYEKAAWILVVLSGLMTLYGSISYWRQNGGAFPGPLDFVFGPFFIVFGIIQVALGPTAFRRGAKWAWYIILLVLLGSLLNTVYDVLQSAFLVILFFWYGGPALLALLLSYRKFFPKASG